MSYGHQQETAADVLRQLLTTDDLPVDVDDRTTLVAVRDQLRLALLDRFIVIARGNVAVDDRFKTERGMLSTLGYRGLQHLAGIIADTPRPADTFAASPVDALAQPAAHPTVGLWRRAAVATSVGNHDLDAGLRTGITAAGSWHLLRDAATAVEAFIVLDARLDSAGLLDRHQHPQRPGSCAHDARSPRRLPARPPGMPPTPRPTTPAQTPSSTRYNSSGTSTPSRWPNDVSPSSFGRNTRAVRPSTPFAS